MIIRKMSPSTYTRVSAVLLGLFLLVSSSCAVVNNGVSEDNSDGPSGLVDVKVNDDLIAEASNTADTQKREIPINGGLSNSYGEPIPADSYGPPQDRGHGGAPPLGPPPIPISDSYGPPQGSSINIGLPIPVYGVPNDPSNHVQYPAPPPDIPPSISGSHDGQSFNLPNFNLQQNYGPPQFGSYAPPPKPIFTGSGLGSFATQSGGYHGPPPPLISHGPPKPVYGLPKPPKIQYGPPKLHHAPPKPQYGPPKLLGPKPQFNGPKPQFGPIKQGFGGIKQHYGPPKPFNLPKPQYNPPRLELGPLRPEYGPPPKPLFLNNPHPVYGPPIAPIGPPQQLKPLFPVLEDTYGPPGKPIGPNDIFSQQITGPDSNYGPPIGIHHGPPQPDPNPRPAHPGIPAPPTPPHILYDGWTPIPGYISKPPSNHAGLGNDFIHPPPPASEGSFISSLHSIGSHGSADSSGGISGSYGLPSISYGTPISSFNVNSIGGSSDHLSQAGSFISTGYSSVSGNEGLKGIDLNSILGSSSDSSGIGLQGSKTVYEAHYTEGLNGINSVPSGSYGVPSGVDGGDSLSVIKSVGFDLGSGSHSDSSSSHISSISSDFSSPSIDSLTISRPYPGPRQLGLSSHSYSSNSIGLKPPSGMYGVPPGGKYGVPPPPPPHNVLRFPTSHSHSQLSISYGTPSGSAGSGHVHAIGGIPPKSTISFREPVPQGFLEHIGNSVVHKDTHGINDNHVQSAPSYLPPPVPEFSNIGSSQTFSKALSNVGSSTFNIQASIEPTNLYSLPSVGSPINFNIGGSHSIDYSGSLDSYHAPIATISDSYGAPSVKSQVTTTVEGKKVENSEKKLLSSEKEIIGTDAASLAAAILKNCPYHKALYEAAKNVEQNNPSALASSYVASLSALDANVAASHIAPNVQTLHVPAPGSDSVNYHSSDLSEASHTLVAKNVHSKELNSIVSNNEEKGRKIQNDKVEVQQQTIQQAQSNIDQNQQLFQEYHNLAFQNIGDQSFLEHAKVIGPGFEVRNGVHTIPVQGQQGSYTLQIQSADGLGHQNLESGSIPHEQVLSEGLLQSILQAIEQPQQTQIIVPQEQPIVQQFPSGFDVNQMPPGLVLPEGYEIVPQPALSQIKQRSSEQRGDQNAEEEDHEGGSSIKNPIYVVAPSKYGKHQQIADKFVFSSSDEKAPEIVTPLNIIDDNEIALYFNSHKNEVNSDYGDDDTDAPKEETEDIEAEDDSIETVTEISVESSISASGDDSKNAQQYGDENGKANKKFTHKFGDRITKKSDTADDDDSIS